MYEIHRNIQHSFGNVDLKNDIHNPMIIVTVFFFNLTKKKRKKEITKMGLNSMRGDWKLICRKCESQPKN